MYTVVQSVQVVELWGKSFVLVKVQLRLLNALTLLRNLFWEVTSAIQEQVTVSHFLKTGLHKQPLKFAVEKKYSHKCVFRNIPLNLVLKSFRNTFEGVFLFSSKLKVTNTSFLKNTFTWLLSIFIFVWKFLEIYFKFFLKWCFIHFTRHH